VEQTKKIVLLQSAFEQVKKKGGVGKWKERGKK
jgi:hypothetical protein